MVLVEQRGVCRQVAHEQLLHVAIPGVGADQSVPSQNPAGVGVDDEDRVVARIEQDRVRGFFADP